MSGKAQKMLDAFSHFCAVLSFESKLWQTLETSDSFLDDVLLERTAFALAFVIFLLQMNGVGPMVLKEQQLLIRQ